MRNNRKFEVYGDPESTKNGLIELYSEIPVLLQSRQERRSLSFLRARPRVCIGMDGHLYQGYILAGLSRVKKILDDPKVSDVMFHFRLRGEKSAKSKLKDRILLLHWLRDASTYPRARGVSEIEMTIFSEGEKSRATLSKKQFAPMLKVWERVILESDPHYGILWKEGDMFVGTHIFLTHRPEVVYQVNYFGPKMVENVGKERILGVPDLVVEYGKKVFPCEWEVNELSTGGILLYERSDPSKPGIAGNQEILKKHLGIKDVNLVTF